MRPKIYESGKPHSPYVVHVPRKLSGGKQARCYFSTRADAKAYAEECEAKLAGLGKPLWEGLTPAEIADLTEYAKRLRERRGVAPILAEEAVAQFLKAQTEAGASHKYRDQIRYEGKKFAERFEGCKLGDITRGEVLAWIQSFKKLSPTSRFATFRIASAIFGHGVTMGWIGANPCAGLSRRMPRSLPPKQILKPAQLLALLQHADSRVMRPWLCLGAFAGLRPIEVARLHWEDIDWDRGLIFVRPDVAKQTKRHHTEGRFVTITDALRAWMPATKGRSGPIIPVADAAIKRAKRATVQKAEVTIPHDALRHSFATYHYALHGDGAATAKELGHTTTAMTFRAYARRDVGRDDAQRWFGLRPSGRPMASTRRADTRKS